MKSTILHILCEGQTEERFVKEILAPYLQQFNIYPKAILLLTSKKKNARGGMLSYVQAKRDLSILLQRYRDNDSEHHVFTTMFDFYALPDDFPGHAEVNKIHDPREQVNYLEKAFANDIKTSSFIPYIQLHEFEALLFVDIEMLKKEYPQASHQIQTLKLETDAYKDPEMINNSPETAPSKRIIKALAKHYNYNKVQSGAAITSVIGIERILNCCQHFNSWIESIRSSAQ